MEDLLYELSVVGVFPPPSPASSPPPSASAMETEAGKENGGVIEKDEEDALVPLAALEGMYMQKKKEKCDVSFSSFFHFR